MLLVLLAALVSLAACGSPRERALLEPAVELGAGGSPHPVATAEGQAVLFSAEREEYSGRDVLYCESPLAEAGPACVQLNETNGEALDNGENGPILGVGADGSLFAVWIARDTRHRLANRVHFSRRPPAAAKWETPRTLNDDVAPATHDFPNAAVGPDGALHVFWLDRREVPKEAFPPYPTGGEASDDPSMPGTVALYAATSRDHGATFEPNRRVAKNVCACCRPSAVTVGDTVLMAYRSVTASNMRNIVATVSEDGGRSWRAPRIVSDDGWQLDACPHSGPSLTVLDDTVFVAWMDGSDGSARVYSSSSRDAGSSFEPRGLVSAECARADHPYLSSFAGEVIAAYECMDEDKKAFASFRTWSPAFDHREFVVRIPDAVRPHVTPTTDGLLASWAENGVAHVARKTGKASHGETR